MDYDKAYRRTENVFGPDPEEILTVYYYRINKSRPVLDIGAGQGRNGLFLAREGFVVDAIDPSGVATEIVSTAARKEDLAVRTHRCGFETFTPDLPYSAILLFGIIQEQSWESITLLLEKIHIWSSRGSLLFATAFTTDDPAFVRDSEASQAVGKNSFADHDGTIRTYLKSGEMLGLFHRWKVIHYWEGMGPEHRHGDGPPERHAKVEAVFQRPHPSQEKKISLTFEEALESTS